MTMTRIADSASSATMATALPTIRYSVCCAEPSMRPIRPKKLTWISSRVNQLNAHSRQVKTLRYSRKAAAATARRTRAWSRMGHRPQPAEAAADHTHDDTSGDEAGDAEHGDRQQPRTRGTDL